MLNIDDYWLDDNQLIEISHKVPSTQWGKKLSTEAWPQLYQGILSSNTYRGCAAGLFSLYTSVRRCISLHQIEQIIVELDQSLKISQVCRSGSEQYSGAFLSITNAWQRSHSDLTIDQIVASLESELIYVSQLFVKARQNEMTSHSVF